MTEQRLAGRVILVAGASRGLGAAVARACAAEGAHLVLVARTKGALEEVDDAVRAEGGEGATLVVADLTQGELVDKLGAALHRRFGRLDGLAMTAAELGPLTPVSHLEPKQLERAVAVNLLAAHRLIRSLDPLLRAAPDARAVFVTDGNGRNRAYWGGYAASKAALEALVLSYANELRLTPVGVNLFDPGPMATRLRNRAYPGENPASRPDPGAAAAALRELLLPGCTRRGELVVHRG